MIEKHFYLLWFHIWHTTVFLLLEVLIKENCDVQRREEGFHNAQTPALPSVLFKDHLVPGTPVVAQGPWLHLESLCYCSTNNSSECPYVINVLKYRKCGFFSSRKRRFQRTLQELQWSLVWWYLETKFCYCLRVEYRVKQMISIHCFLLFTRPRVILHTVTLRTWNWALCHDVRPAVVFPLNCRYRSKIQFKNQCNVLLTAAFDHQLVFSQVLGLLFQ